jgi:uncharacterized membrane protein
MSRLSASPSQAPRASSPPAGFLLERGRFKPVVPPPGLEDPDPAPFDLNDRGQIVGPYVDLAAQAARGFLLTRGRLDKVDVPGAKATQPQGINNRGQIVGKYSNTTGDMTAPGALIRGFLLDRGRFTIFRVPGAQVTFAFGINDQGQVVGYSAASLTATTASGFLRDARGRFTAINRPGATITAAFDINNRGQIVGFAPIADTPPSPQPTSTPPMARMA